VVSISRYFVKESSQENILVLIIKLYLWLFTGYGANKFAKFGIFKAFWLRNPHIWTDPPEIWHGVGDCCFPPPYQIWRQSVKCVTPAG